MHGGNTRSIFAQFLIWLSNALQHLAQNKGTTPLSLSQSRGQNLTGNTLNLNIHLNSSNAFSSTCYLEVHITQSILHTLNIGKNGIIISILYQAHSHTGNWTLNRHTGMHQGKSAAANGPHRARAVGLQYLGNHANSIWEILSGRNNRHQSTLCQSTMTNLTTAWATNRTSLAYRVAREIVLMDIMLAGFYTKAINYLLISQRAQGSNSQNLSLTTGKQARTMSTRQNTYLTANRTNLFYLTTIRANLLLGNHAANDFLNNLVEHIRNFLNGIWINLQEMLQSLSLNSSNMLVTIQLIWVAYCSIQLVSSIGTNSLLHFLWYSKELNLSLSLAYSLLHLILESNDLLDFLVTEENGLQNNFLWQLISTSLNHHNCITGASNGQIQIRLLTLLNSRVDNKLPINTAYTHTGNRAHERNIRNSQSTGCTNHSCNLWCIVLLYGQYGSYNLYIISIALWEQRTNRTVNETAAQNCRLARTTFSLYKTARNLANGVHLLLIINGQREEINALTRLLRSGSSNQYNGFTITNQNSTICLLCHLASLNGKSSAAKLHFKTLHQVFPPNFHSFCILS